jgi:hypothetical protein
VELTAAQTRTEQRFEEMTAALRDLAAAQTRTEEQLAVLIGRAWAEGGVRANADLLRLAWQLPHDVNERLKEFHALPAEAPEHEAPEP